MTQHTSSRGTGSRTGPREAGAGTVPFETAQGALFNEVGIDPQSRFIDLETPPARVHVLSAGPLTDELPLVFVHGSAAFGAFLAPLMARFDDTPMVAFDRPGYGLSDPFVYTPNSFQRTVVDVIDGVLGGLGIDRADLVGHSMGGHASLKYALERPDRVERITTLGAIPGFPGTTPPFPLRLLTAPLLTRLVQRMQKTGEEGVLDVAEVFGEREAIQRHPAFIRAIAAADADPKSAAAGLSEFGALVTVLGWRSSARIREDEVRELQQPTTVIWGDRDPLGGPDDVCDAVDAIPDVRFEPVDAGHIPYLDHAERCAQLIRETRDGPD